MDSTRTLFGKFFLSFLPLSLLISSGYAQSKTPGQPRALSILDSTKERDGLLGAVRRVKTEYAKINLKEGQSEEGPRHLLELTTYGVKGNRIENVSYPIKDPLVGKEEYRYDDKGNIVEMVLRDEQGTILSREAYDYEFDPTGNWTKMVTSLVVTENGEVKREPVEVTYRTLTYYYSGERPAARETVAVATQVSQVQSQVAGPTADTPLSEPTAQLNTETTEKAVAAIKKEESAAAESAPKTETSKPASNRYLKKGKVLPGIVVESPKDAATSREEPKGTITNPAAPTETAGSKTSGGPPRVESNTATKPVDNAPVELNTASKRAEAPVESNTKSKRAEAPVESTTTSKRTEAPVKSHKASKGAEAPVESHMASKGAEAPADSNTATKPVETPAANNNEAPPKTAPAETAEKTEMSLNSSQRQGLEFYKMGRQKFEAGDAEGAIRMYRDALAMDLKSAEVQLSLGHAYISVKKDKEAVKAFQESVRINPQLTEAYYGLGFSAFRLERYKDAMDAFKKAVALNPDMAKAHYGLALAYQQLDKPDAVVQEHRVLQRLDPSLANKLMQSFPEIDFNCRLTRFCK